MREWHSQNQSRHRIRRGEKLNILFHSLLSGTIVSMCFLRGLYAPNCRCPSRWLGVFLWLAEFSLLTSHVGDALIRKAQGLTVWVVEEGPPRHERTAAAEVIEHRHVKG